MAGSLSGGAVMGFTPELDVGVFATGLAGSTTHSSPSMTLTSLGGGLGVYSTYSLADGGRFGVSASQTWASHDINHAGVTGSFNSGFTRIDAHYDRSFVVGPGVSITPSVVLSWERFSTGAYTNSGGTAAAAAWSEQTSISTGLSISRPFMLDGPVIKAVTPHIGVTGSVVAAQTVSGTLPASGVHSLDLSRATVGLSGGVDLALAGGAAFNLDTSIGGIGGNSCSYGFTFGFREPLP